MRALDVTVHIEYDDGDEGRMGIVIDKWIGTLGEFPIDVYGWEVNRVESEVEVD